MNARVASPLVGVAMNEPFAVALLVSPCRSSVVSVAPESGISAVVDTLNGSGPGNLSLFSPWRLAEQRQFATRSEADSCACVVGLASGVRARDLQTRGSWHVDTRACIAGAARAPRPWINVGIRRHNQSVA